MAGHVKDLSLRLWKSATSLSRQCCWPRQAHGLIWWKLASYRQRFVSTTLPWTCPLSDFHLQVAHYFLSQLCSCCVQWGPIKNSFSKTQQATCSRMHTTVSEQQESTSQHFAIIYLKCFYFTFPTVGGIKLPVDKNVHCWALWEGEKQTTPSMKAH